MIGLKSNGMVKMARTVQHKELINTRLATNYGGWTYCENCNQNIGYLCYSTYDRIVLKYQCQCGSQGSVVIDFADSIEGHPLSDELVLTKNRWCCPDDGQPLITLLDQKLKQFELDVTCKSCGKIYHQTKTAENAA